MEEKNRQKVIYLIGGLAFLIAVVSFVFGVIDFIALYKSSDGQILSVGIELYDMIIELVFAFLELALGISLIKQWKDGEKIDIHKTVSKLVSAVVYASFVKFLLGEIISSVVSGNFSNMSVSVVYVIVYLVFGIIMMSIPSLIKKRQLMQLYWVMLISSVFAIGFCSFDVGNGLMQNTPLEQVAIDLANGVLMCLITVFALGTVVFYIKNPLVLDRDIKENEDSEVIKTTKTYEKVRLYLTRGTNDGVNALIVVLTLLSVALGIAGVALYAIENELFKYLVGDLGQIINSFIDAFSSTNLNGVMNLVVSALMVFIYSLIYLSVGIGAFTHKGSAKIGVITISSVGVTISLVTGIILFMSVFFNFSFTGGIDLKDYSIFEIIILILYVVYVLTGKIYANLIKDVNDGILQRGDSYHSHAKSIARIASFCGIYSIIAFAVHFLMYLNDGEMRLSYLAFLLSTALIVIATNLEVKHPFSEYTVVKRKLKTEDNA